VTAQFLLVYDIGVAGFANVMPGESRGAGGDFADGGATIVAILSKSLRNDGRAQQYEYRQQDSDDDGKPDEMFDVLEHGCFPAPGRDAAQARYTL
jgi:hypothetical protein